MANKHSSGLTGTYFKYGFVVPFLHVVAMAGLAVVDHWWAVVLLALLFYYPVQLLGHNIGSHKLFSHRSFAPKKWYPYVAVYFNFLSLHGSPSTSALIHRLHHRYSDTDQDPSDANKGRWYAYMGWIFHYEVDRKHYILIKDLKRDFPWLLTIEKYELPIALTSFLLALLINLHFGIALLIGSLLAFHAPLLVNGFLHTRVHQDVTEPIDSPFFARWINPVANHATHHRNPGSYDFSSPHAKDWSAIFIRRFLQEKPPASATSAMG